MRIIVAECEIDYEGRAASSLSSGERIIIIKNDNTLLIHTENKLKPINYMPKSTIIEYTPNIISFDTITAIRQKPYEIITIYIKKMIQDIKLELKDSEDFILMGSEKNLQDYFKANPEDIEPGCNVLETEFKTPAGNIDIWAQDINSRFVIIELKRVKGSLAAVSQLKRYYDALLPDYPELRGILFADGISAPAFELLEKYGFEFQNVDIQKVFNNLQDTKFNPDR